jgi:hypothetical protein
MEWKSHVCLAYIAGLVGADILFTLVRCATLVSGTFLLLDMLAPLT